MHAVLARAVDDPEERGRHLALAARAADESVVGALEQAAAQARARGAPEVAAELQERALEMTPAGHRLAADRRALAAAEDYLHVGMLGRARSLLTATLERAEERTCARGRSTCSPRRASARGA